MAYENPKKVEFLHQLTEILTTINTQVELYETLKLNIVSDQSEILRTLTIQNYYLEQHLDKEEVIWQDYYDKFESKTHQRKEQFANFSHPEYKKLKRIINRVDIIQGVIRSTMKHA